MDFRERAAKQAYYTGQSIGQIGSSAVMANVTSPPRQHCIASVIEDIEISINESVNSAGNLADKLSGSQPQCEEKSCNAPMPISLLSRLDCIRAAMNILNAQLNRAHSSING